MRKVAGLVFGLMALTSAVTSKEAFAGDTVAFGVGLLGHLGAAASTGMSPEDVAKASMNGPMTGDLSKAGPSFGGAYGGIGAMAELRILKMLGIEVDYTRSLITASGKVPLSAAFPNPAGGMLPDVDLTFSQWQHQIAILGKFALATPLIAPFIGVGPEFVFPDDPGKSCMMSGSMTPGSCPISVKPGVPGINITAHASAFTMLTGVVGLELKLPIPKIDIRIPVAARFSYNLSTPDNPAVCGSLNGMALDASVPAGGNCRLQFNGTLSASTQSLTIDYRTEWKYMIGGQVGLAIYF